MTARNLSSPSKTQGTEEVPHLGAIRPGPSLAAGLYLLLVGSAALALWAREYPSAVPREVGSLAPWVFLVFILCFATYRMVLVRARKYPAFKAFFQVGAALLFFMLLLPGARGRYAEAPTDPLEILIVDPNPHVRALSAEVAKHRPDAKKYVPSLVAALDDSDASVRREAHQSLVRITGSDLGDPEQPSGREAWKTQVR